MPRCGSSLVPPLHHLTGRRRQWWRCDRSSSRGAVLVKLFFTHDSDWAPRDWRARLILKFFFTRFFTLVCVSPRPLSCQCAVDPQSFQPHTVPWRRASLRQGGQGRRRAAAVVRVVRWVREGGRRDPLEAANALQNKLTRAQYLDEVTWTTKSWLGLQKQRISVVLHTAIAEQVVNELACGGGGRVHGAKCLATLAGVA